MVEVKADLKNQFVFEAQNRCVYKGCFSPEDEWEIKVIAETVDELEKKAAEEIVKTRIEVTSPDYYVAEYLIYKGNQFQLKKVDDRDGDHFWKRLQTTDYYKKLETEKRAELVREQEAEARTQDKEQLIQLEKEQARLKAKLGVS